MAGFSKFYLIGNPGGFLGANGVNKIHFLIMVGDADRQWLEPQYLDNSIRPIGKIERIVPSKPYNSNSLLDACIAFCPVLFRKCPSLALVEETLKNCMFLDFHLRADSIPGEWFQLREEARPVFRELAIWEAKLQPYQHS